VILGAALCAGVFCYSLAGHVLGRPPRVLVWRRDGAARGRQQLWLAQAGVGLSPARFWLGSVAVGLVAFVGCALITGTPLVALVPAIAVASLPRAYYGRRRAERLQAVQGSWPDGLRDLVASISAGRSLNGALVEMARSGPAALRVAFARFESNARMLGVVPALELVREELADPTSDRVIEVLVLASERGGQVVREILEDLVVATTKDLKLRDEIESDGLEMRINARAVLVLPWFVLVALTVRGGAFRDFYATGPGVVVVLVGAALSAVGYLWISHLGRTHEERRVLGGGRLATRR
jgi:tight adherence protein B